MSKGDWTDRLVNILMGACVAYGAADATIATLAYVMADSDSPILTATETRWLASDALECVRQLEHVSQ